ncbi:outer membrane beta-barrel protein [Desulfosediminicola flagellatus]|uniref:outer membrane beta-barrel protein n=1 Tax=Desulfosediminicola flagellatus TaxID=2569541 RepID=UPI0010AC1E6E|nr:outer membrane beta-barrel protein [Desulfosediminicola flagellatus]
MNYTILSAGMVLLVSFPAQVFAQKTTTIRMDEMIVVASNSAGSTTAQKDVPMGQSGNGNVSLLPEESGTTDADQLFGTQGGYAHPYLSVEGAYTDNLFNVNSNEISSSLYRISTGVWASLPRKKDIPVTISPNNSSSGGLAQQIEDYGGTDRYQVVAHAGLDINRYSEDSDLDSEDYFFEGLARYNMASGLSLQILDRYETGHDGFGAGGATEDDLREYNTNLFMATADWDLTEKITFKADYSNFLLNYDQDLNSFLERTDNAFDIYGYYNLTSKTSLFLQYSHIDVEYDSASANDNSQDYVYGGVTWNTTEKLSFMLKAGLQSKEFDVTGGGYSDSEAFALDLQTIYRITEKTDLSLDVYRKIEESDSIDASEKVVLGAQLGYSQEINEKIGFTCDFVYENADYTQLAGLARDEDMYFVRPAVQYLFKEWLMAELAYSFDKRDSSDDDYDFQTNTFYLSLNMAM